MTRFLRFCLVGGVGFVVDAGVLQLLASVDEWLRFVVANAMGAAVNYA